MSVRAKFRLIAITEHYPASAARSLRLAAVVDETTPENQRFARYTPAGQLEMACNNPSVLGQFTLGADYYLDFTPVAES